MFDHGPARGDAFVLLRVVTHRHLVAELHLAEIGRELAHQRTQQRGLARAVQTEHEQPLAPTDLERHVLEHDLRTERLGEVDDLERDPARVRRIRQLHAQRLLALAELDATRAQLVDPAIEGLGDAGALRGLVPHGIRERAQPADLRILPHRDLRAPLFVGFPRNEVLRVGAAVLDELTFVEVQHACDRLVEQREVVTDDEQRAAVGAQERHQPGLGVDVEVVRGFVEEHEVAARRRGCAPAPRADVRHRRAH